MKTLEINLIVKLFKEGDYYIAYSPELQISTQGNSKRQAKQRFAERLQIFFERSIQTNTLEDRLKSLGWNIEENEPPKQLVIPRELLKAKECQSFAHNFAF